MGEASTQGAPTCPLSRMHAAPSQGPCSPDKQGVMKPRLGAGPREPKPHGTHREVRPRAWGSVPASVGPLICLLSPLPPHTL